jgi:prepilin signal peptidase PulO-like enzyme (type II secretory pathway)
MLYPYLALFTLIAIIDLEHRRVLNVVLGPATLAAVILAAVQSLPAFWSACWGGLSGFLLFGGIALVRPGAIGAGDIKLAGMIGFVVGFPQVFVALIAGIVAGGVGALLLLSFGRVHRKSTIAYAPYLSLGACIALLHGPQILAWYMHRLVL